MKQLVVCLVIAFGTLFNSISCAEEEILIEGIPIKGAEEITKQCETLAIGSAPEKMAICERILSSQEELLKANPLVVFRAGSYLVTQGREKEGIDLVANGFIRICFDTTLAMESDSSCGGIPQIMLTQLQQEIVEATSFEFFVDFLLKLEKVKLANLDWTLDSEFCYDQRWPLNHGMNIFTGVENKWPSDARILELKNETKTRIRNSPSREAEIMSFIGYRFAEGLGVPQNKEKAVHYWTKAAEAGDADAQAHLASYYEQGLGVEPDGIKALYWCKKAAEQGHPMGQSNLGIAYSRGQGVPKDTEKAIFWWTKAAEQEHPKAQFFLGHLYFEGAEVPQDFEKAIFWWTKAAELHEVNSQCCLAQCYAEGKGVAKNFERAVHWWEQAAEQGNMVAQSTVAYFYAEGLGVPQNIEHAIDLWKMAAEGGDACAQSNLGELYLEGRGVPKDSDQAILWYKKAAKQGFPPAQAALKKIENEKGKSTCCF